MWFRKYDTVFILHNTDFPTITEKQNTIPKHKFYFVNQETKTKLFLAVTVKIDFSMHIIFYENSFAVAVRAHELSWHKILFSNLNWKVFLGQAPTSICYFFCLPIRPSVAHHISGTIHHLIIIFGTSVKWYLQVFYSFFKFTIFQLLEG